MKSLLHFAAFVLLAVASVHAQIVATGNNTPSAGPNPFVGSQWEEFRNDSGHTVNAMVTVTNNLLSGWGAVQGDPGVPTLNGIAPGATFWLATYSYGPGGYGFYSEQRAITGYWIVTTPVTITWNVTSPTGNPTLIANGASQTGATATVSPTNAPVTIAGNSAVNAGTYLATATLNNTMDYSWAAGQTTSVSWAIGAAAPPVPKVTISAYPTSPPPSDLSKPIVNPTTLLTWTSTDATSVSVTCDKSVANDNRVVPNNTDLNGTNVQVTLPANTDPNNSVNYTFAINATGLGGNAVPKTVQVRVPPAQGIVVDPLTGHAVWEADQPVSANPSTAFTMTKKVTNDGTHVWDTTNYQYEIWTSWGGFFTNGNTLTPSGAVAPGGSSNVSFSLTAPSTPGTYTVTLKPIIPGVGYFLNVGTYTVIVTGSGPSSYTLTTAANPTNAGTVTGGGTYTAGSNATATASANAGWQLTGFTGADSTSGNTATVAMNSNRTVTANFSPYDGSTYSVTTAVSPAAAATAGCTAAASPASGIARGGSSTLTNAAAGGYTFTGYTINSGTCTANGSSLANITSDISVTANFSQPTSNVQIVIGIDGPPLGNVDCSLRAIAQASGTVQTAQNHMILTLPRSVLTNFSGFSVNGSLTTPTNYEIYRWDIVGATKTSDSSASTPGASSSAGIGIPYGDSITAIARTRTIQMHGPSIAMQSTLPTLLLSPGNPARTSVPVTVTNNDTVSRVSWNAQVYYGSGSSAYCWPATGSLSQRESVTTNVYTPQMNQAGPYKIVVTAALPAPSLPMYHFGDPAQTNTTAYPVYIHYWAYYQGTDDPPTIGPPSTSELTKLVQPGDTYPQYINFWPARPYTGYAQSATWADPSFTVTKEATGMITESAYVSLRFKVIDNNYAYHWVTPTYYDEDQQQWLPTGDPDQWLPEDPSECWTLTPSDGLQGVGQPLTISAWSGGGSYNFSHWEDDAGNLIGYDKSGVTVTVPSGYTTYYAVMRIWTDPRKTPVSITASPLTFAYDGNLHGPTNTASIAGVNCSVSDPLQAQATAPGNYTYSLGVPSDFYITSVNGIAGNGPVHWSIGSAPQTVTLSPVSSTITAGSSITFTAGGGQNGYDWSSTVGVLDPGRDATKTVSFPHIGTFTVSAQSPKGGNYAASNLATANVTVIPVPIEKFDFDPKTFTYIPNTKQGPTIKPTPNGASYSTAGIVKEIIVHKYHFAVDGIGDYTGHAECDWEITKAHADVKLGSLSQIYDGNPCYATATTTPGGLNVTMTYNGGTTAPINVGSYAVVGTVNDPNYEGSATDTLVVKKADQQITFGSLPDRTYLNAPFAIGATAINTANGLPSLPVSFRVLSGPATINANTVTITGAGSVTIQAYQDGDANYNAAPSVNQTFAVAKAPATVTLGSLNQTYDGTPKAATAATTPGGLTVTLAYNGGATAPTAAGSYAVVGTISDPNYTGSASGTLVISKATPTVTWATPAAIAYGTALSATQLNATASVPGSFVYTPAAGTVLNAGAGQSLTVTFTPTDAADYTTAIGSTTITVNQASLTATANNQSKVYGAANPALTISYSGFVNGDTAASITQPGIATAATAASGVGTYPITLSGGSAANYSLTLVIGTLTVNSVTLTVTANNQSRAYGSSNPALTLAYSGFVNGDTAAAITPPTATTAATAASAAGSYPITLTGGSAANYTLTLVNGMLSVTKATLTVTGNNASKVYGAANPALTVAYSGFVNGDTAAALTTAPTVGTAATAASPAGSYTITPAGGVSPNYAFSYVNGTLTVTQATLTATANDQTKAYGAANPALTISYSGFVNGDTAAAITPPTASTAAIAASATGSYPITLTGGSAANYALTLVNGTLTVTKAPLTVTGNNASKVYGSANPALTVSYSGFVNGDTAAALTTAPTASTAATAASAAGTYAIMPAGGVSSNYAFSYVNGTLTVAKVGLTATANDQSKVYGAANPSLTIGYSGFVNGDTNASITQPGISTAATTGSAVGTYSITLSGGAATNYTLTLVNGTLTVTPATLAISANNASKVYGAANPVFGYTPSGFVNGETAAVLNGTPSLTTTATAASGVGSYTITPAAGSLSATNYVFSFNNGTLSVTAAALAVSANNQSKTYGNANPALTATLSGFVNGDTAAAVSGSASVSTTALTSSAVGSYPITPAAGTLSAANYTFGPFNNGTLTITRANLAVTANNKSKVYGAANPAFDASFSGFVNGDTAAVVSGTASLNTAATAASGIGGYAITPTIGSLSATNYNFATFNNGTLTVTAATVTPSVAATSKVYDGGMAATITSRSLAGVIGADAVTLTGGSGIFASKTVGTGQTVTVTGLALGGAAAGNYQLSSTTATTTADITAKTLTVSGVTAANKAYDGTAVATLNWGSAALIGVVGGDLASLVTTGATGTFSDKNVANGKTVTVAGLALNGVDSGNYSLTQPSAIANITQATPTITWAAPAAITYGTALSATQLDATASVPGSFVYAQAAGTVLNAGAGQALTVAFTPTDTTNYTTASGGTTITVNRAGQIVTLTPLASTVLLGTPIAYTAAGSSTGAYAWGGTAGASGSGATQTVNPVGGPGNYTVTVYAPGNSNYNDSPLVNAMIVMQAPTLTLSLTPFVSNYTVTDTSSPLNGKTYKRTWQDSGTWHAYLGRSGDQFQIVGQGTTAVQAFELQALEPNADPSAWYSLATIAPPTGAPNGPGVGVTGVFSVSLDTGSAGAALVPQSYAQGSPKTGVWQLRARTQDNSGTWSDWSNVVAMTVDLPLTTTAIPAQSLPPAGPIGGWFTASDQKTFSLPVWIP